MTRPHIERNQSDLQREIPRYIRIKSNSTRNSQFPNLFLAQELTGGKQPEPGYAKSVPQTAIGSKMSSGGDATIWVADFSLSGQYLAVAGKDRSIKVFKVIATEEERREQEKYESQFSLASKSPLAPVFLSQPYRVFKGHSAEVLALSWSKNDFLLSGSADKTVRLWHPSQPRCIRVFQHDRTVTSVAFHPTDDRYFLSGSFDATLRLWSITEMSIVHSAPMADIITAVAFSPDGKVAICGTFNGICILLSTKGLIERNRMCIKSSDSKDGVCFKITGLQAITSCDGIDKTGQAKLMITTNDSLVRIYHLADYGLQYTLEGIRNQSSQIHARFNDSGEYVICGGEDDEVHIWHLKSGEPNVAHERFHTHSEAVTNAIIAPKATREIISLSKDPIYDLCGCRTKHIDLHGARNHAAMADMKLESSTKPTPKIIDASENSSSRHFGGHIIVTTDTMGKIKVYRQDCAFGMRYHVSQSYQVTQ